MPKISYNVINPRDNKKVADEILAEINGIFDELGIEYFLLFGTALGIYRDKTYIQGDDDIDLGIKLSTDKEFKEILFEFILHGFLLVDAKGFDPLNLFKFGMDDKRWSALQIDLLVSSLGMVFLSFVKKDTKIDLFFCYRNKKVGRYIVGDKRTTPVEYLDKLEKIKYNGITFNIPSPIEEYLVSMYGKDWNIPIGGKSGYS